jgi:hypothetical protein
VGHPLTPELLLLTSRPLDPKGEGLLAGGADGRDVRCDVVFDGTAEQRSLLVHLDISIST